MLAVRADRRDRGIGRQLKEYQRDLLLAMGVPTIYWTFDPLVARNAHLNLHHLGASIEEYVPDFYGTGADSPVDRGIGTDRFVVRWDLGRETAGGGEGRQTALEDRRTRVEIPADIHELKARSPSEALDWRMRTRRAFLDGLARGSRVVGFERGLEGHGGSYLLAPSLLPPLPPKRVT